jgi:hypothetical protein
MDEVEPRIRERAEKLWRERGEPAGGPDACLDLARELIAIEENHRSTLMPVDAERLGPYGEPVEPRIAIENEGEFPTLTDQGEEQTAPHLPDRDRS